LLGLVPKIQSRKSGASAVGPVAPRLVQGDREVKDSSAGCAEQEQGDLST
jgi:hypothetical protein